MNTLNRYLELAQMILEGRGLPFLGAGISVSGEIPSNHQENDNIEPTIRWMVKELIKKVKPKLNSCEKRTAIRYTLTQKCENTEQFESLEKSLQQWVRDRLGLFCGAILQQGLLSHSEIVDCLKIHRFADLLPTPAHIYIAFLVRETLINETITTNYDCGLERAVYATFGEETGNGQAARPGSPKHPVVSIYDLSGYRKHASRRLMPFNRGGVLRVYKINGCAGKLARASEHYRSILLADSHLDRMDDRRWARDLFQDRVRSRSLVFSGFGSDEPQVRFIVSRLLEEFEQQDDDNGYADSIWVHAYERYPTHTQQKFLRQNPANPGQNRDRFFSGSDTKSLFKYTNRTGPEDEKLSADLFWQTIFQLIFLALIDRYTDPGTPLALIDRYTVPGTPGYFFLTQFDESSRPLQHRQNLLKWIDPAGLGQKILRGELLNPDSKKINISLERINKIVGYNDDTTREWAPRTGIPLCLWLRALYRIKMPCNFKEYYYLPLLNYIEIILSLLSLCCFANDKKADEFPLLVEISDDNIPSLFFVHNKERFRLFASAKRETIKQAVSNSTDENSITGIHENNSLTYVDNLESFPFAVENESTIDLRYVVPVPITDIISVCIQKQSGDNPEDSNIDIPLLIRHVRRTGKKPLPFVNLKETSKDNDYH